MTFYIALVLMLSFSLQTSSTLQGPLLALTPAQQNEIVLYDVQTSQTRHLRLGGGYINVWGFSPSGCQILYTQVESNGLAHLYSVDLNGENIRSLIEYSALPATQWGVWEPQWSPDGSKIAFTMFRDGFEGKAERLYHIAWIPAEGGTPTFYSQTGREHSPRWSPDGQWLAYISYDPRVAGPDIYSTAEPTAEPQPGAILPTPTLLNEADLWIVSADATEKYRHTAFPVGSVNKPEWSPDGDLLSFVYSPSPSNDTFWLIGSTQGSQPTQLSFNWSLVLDTTWLPDSSAILGVARDFRTFQENQLWQIPLVGNADTDAFLYLETPELHNVDYPRFSKDGHYLALRSAYTLNIIDIQQKSIIYTSSALKGNTPPVWSPAGFKGEIDCSL